MKNIIFLSIFILYSLQSQELSEDLILEIEPEIQYDKNMKYDNPTEKYSESKKDNKEDSTIGINADVNKEEKTLDKLMIDVGKKF